MRVIMIGEQHCGHSVKAIRHGLILRGHSVNNIYTRKTFQKGGHSAVKDEIESIKFENYDLAFLWNPRIELTPEIARIITDNIFTIWYTNDAPAPSVNPSEVSRLAIMRLCHAGIYPSSEQCRLGEGMGQGVRLLYPPYDLWPWRYSTSTEKVADVVFMGNTCYSKEEWPQSHFDRKDIALSLIEAGLDFKAMGHWDENPRAWGTQYGGIKKENYYGFVGHDNVPGLLANIPISINHHPCPHIEHYTNYRMVLSMCAGSMVLSDTVNGLEDIFRDKEHLVYYKNLKDLTEKAKYYLEHVKERKKIAERGQRRMLALNSCTTFADKIEELYDAS